MDEAIARQWIESMLDEPLPSSFHDSLRSGIRLCKLLNIIQKGTIPRIRTRLSVENQIQNVKFYLEGCIKLGVRQPFLFDAVKFYTGDDDMSLIVKNVLELKRVYEIHIQNLNEDRSTVSSLGGFEEITAEGLRVDSLNSKMATRLSETYEKIAHLDQGHISDDDWVHLQ